MCLAPPEAVRKAGASAASVEPVTETGDWASIRASAAGDRAASG
jgi:hypothetical protein